VKPRQNLSPRLLQEEDEVVRARTVALARVHVPVPVPLQGRLIKRPESNSREGEEGGGEGARRGLVHLCKRQGNNEEFPHRRSSAHSPQQVQEGIGRRHGRCQGPVGRQGVPRESHHVVDSLHHCRQGQGLGQVHPTQGVKARGARSGWGGGWGAGDVPAGCTLYRSRSGGRNHHCCSCSRWVNVLPSAAATAAAATAKEQAGGSGMVQPTIIFLIEHGFLDGGQARGRHHGNLDGCQVRQQMGSQVSTVCCRRQVG
jgi:hypothetical protein